MTDALASFDQRGRVVVLSHFDADGLGAAAILLRALRQSDRTAEPLVIGKTGSPWEADTRDQLAKLKPAGLIVAIPPLVVGDVALILLDSPCQIHPLIAQQWRGRLKDKIVIAANRGYRAGWVHFAARSASGRDLIDFLAEHRPAGADGRYGNGHAQATGGALPVASWNEFDASLGMPKAQVEASAVAHH
ncbi:hypothetical protein ACMGDM_19210 [Sphingomonas sp. DT-51]|uniref:hypothetical protein n=1 Tax=Sphingomonas sp. DT-51 TaxID=3396165 RepID=UPI003F1CBC33